MRRLLPGSPISHIVRVGAIKEYGKIFLHGNIQEFCEERLFAIVAAVNGIDRSYPLVTPVYAVIRKSDTPEKSSVRLRDWLLTPEGQSLVKESGYVPLR